MAIDRDKFIFKEATSGEINFKTLEGNTYTLKGINLTAKPDLILRQAVTAFLFIAGFGDRENTDEEVIQFMNSGVRISRQDIGEENV